VSHISLRTINEEHATLSAMLQSLLMMIKRGPHDAPELFFDILRAMLFYIDEVPEKQHHPKETELLFPLVSKRSPTCAEVIQRLNTEHEKGEASIRELQHLLLAWEILGDSRRGAFETAAQQYVNFYKEHMHLEETVIIPEALKVLNADDWRLVDAAFSLNSDPLSTTKQRDSVYDRLFTKITLRTPAPIGLGQD
jgi:hemerythrin-like domain-containing protein